MRASRTSSKGLSSALGERKRKRKRHESLVQHKIAQARARTPVEQMPLHERSVPTSVLNRLSKCSNKMNRCLISSVVGGGNLVILRIGIDAEVEFTPSSTEGRRVESTPLSCQSC